MPEATTREKKKPGRKAETPAQRLARLEIDLAAARMAVEEGRQRGLAAIGSAVLAEASEDADFNQRLRQIVTRRATKKAEKADVLALLGNG